MPNLLETAIEDAADLLGVGAPIIRARAAAEISAENTKEKRLREQCQKVILSAARSGMYVALAQIEIGTSDAIVNAQVAELEEVGYTVKVSGPQIRIEWIGA